VSLAIRARPLEAIWPMGEPARVKCATSIRTGAGPALAIQGSPPVAPTAIASITLAILANLAIPSGLAGVTATPGCARTDVRLVTGLMGMAAVVTAIRIGLIFT